MKLLDIFNDAFGKLPKNGNIKKFLHEVKLKMGEEKFCEIFLQWFGSRGGNEYLDYGALALKINHLFKNKYRHFNYSVENEDLIDREIINRLLFDDRHDLYQNIPYYLRDFLKINKSKQLKDFWNDIADVLIDSFNENGTGDILHLDERQNNL